MGEDSTDEQAAGRTAADPSGGGRRQGDRRKAQTPFEGPDRRQGDRRSGADRRTTQREDSSDG